MVFPWLWFIMSTSFTGYADLICHVISNFHIQRSRFGQKSDNFCRYSKKSWTLLGSSGLLFPTPGDPWHLVDPWQHHGSREGVVRIVEGNSRAEALLNSGLRKKGWNIKTNLHITGEPTWAFVPIRMWGENTTVSKRAGHPHFHCPRDRSCHSTFATQYKSRKLNGRTIYSLVYCLQPEVYSVHFHFPVYRSPGMSLFQLVPAAHGA